MSADAERRSRLLSVKLRALVREHEGSAEEPAGEPAVFALGAAFLAPDAAWILVDGDASSALGPVVAWALPKDRPIRIVAEHGSGILARRASLLDADIRVWRADERALVPAVAEPRPVPPSPSPDHLAFVPLIESAGADALVEHGVVVGEVRGLEMCRVVADAEGDARLEVGMGAHDREAFAMVHGDLPTEDALRQVIDAVLPHRLPGANPHPLNQFCAERLTRWTAFAEPSVVGFRSLAAAEPPVARTTLKDAVPCVAVGETDAGTRAVAVFFHGASLDAVPFACDAADMHDADEIVLVARRRDVTPSIEKLAALSRRPARFAFIGS